MNGLVRVEKVNSRKKYHSARVHFKSRDDQESVLLTDTKGKTPRQWLRRAFQEAERQGNEFERMGGYYD
jgi:hypothetical protein